MPGLMDMFNDPGFAMAAGLLSPTPNRSFGGGLLQGLQAAQASQQNNRAAQLQQLQMEQAKMKIAEAERQALERQKLQELWGTPGQEMTGPTMPGQERGYAGGAGILADRRVDHGELMSLLQYSDNPLQSYVSLLSEPDPTGSIKNYEYLIGQGISPTEAQKMAFSGGTTINLGTDIKPPTGFMLNPEGTGVVRIPGASYSADEMKNYGFAERMLRTNDIMSKLEAKGFDPASAGQRALHEVPFVGNFLTSDDWKQYNQAAENWVRANLRKESGAVIGPEEMADEKKNYFPQPGDDLATVQQKARLRHQLTSNMIMSSQGAFDEFSKMKLGEYTPAISPRVKAAMEAVGSDDPNDPLVQDYLEYGNVGGVGGGR